MAGQKTAWGVEVGAYAIKAIRLERDGDSVTVSDFAVIPHKKVLSTPDLDQDEMVRLGMGQFISQKNLEGEHLVMSVPGHSAFARFAKLPPVELRKVPDIVKFEAVQQIPFPIDQVEWDYETFQSEDSPEIEVGIFAITRERVQQRLGLYSELGITPERLTLSPVAVYNAVLYDQDLQKSSKPVILLDIGTNATDLIVLHEGRCWIRTFPLGGTHFTEAIANSFKLSYSKAEKLKHEAATNKYAKQIMQAMRPVFSDLLQDVQRSLGYYQSLHRDADLSDIVGLGSTFKIPGLRKFLGQQLQVEMRRLDDYKKITVTGREAASFHENAVNMATAYGLALQGVGLGAIDINLVPTKTLRMQMWQSKTKWFAAAAAITIIGAGLTFYRPVTERGALNPGGVPEIVRSVISTNDRLTKQFNEIEQRSNIGYAVENFRRLTEDREIWPHLVADAAAALKAAQPQPALVDTNLELVKSIPAGERRLVQLTNLAGAYTFMSDSNSRRISVRMDVELSHAEHVEFVKRTVAKWLEDNAERPGVPYRILPNSISCNPDQRVSVTVGEDGALVDARTPSGAPVTPGTGASSPTAPTISKGGGAGAMGGGAMGRPTGMEPVTPTAAPGGGQTKSGGGGTSATPQAPQPGSDQPSPLRPPTRPTGPDLSTGDGSNASGRPIDMSKDAPLPPRPQVYPAGAQFYRIPITFEIEILAEPVETPQAVDAGANAEVAS
jgi:type IV pilus assembly protein PilM